MERLLPPMNGENRTLPLPTMNLPIDPDQSWLNQDQLIAEYQAIGLRVKILKNPKSLGKNKSLDR